MSQRRYWYQLQTPAANPYSVGSYERVLGPFSGCDSQTSNICAIYAYGGSTPYSSELASGTPLNNAISYAISNGVSAPPDGKPFVYTRPT
jgi:hypothetical protein